MSNYNAAANGLMTNGLGDPSTVNWNGLNDGMDRPLPPTAEIGTSGIPIYAGRVYDEWDPRLQGDLAIRVYREMQTHPIVAGFLAAIDQLIRRVDWDVEPAEGEEKESDEVNLVSTCLNDMSMPWALTLSQNFSSVPYGWSFSEIVYKKRLGYEPNGTDENGRPLPSSKHRDGLYGWRKIALRTQETRWRWAIDDEGGVQGMWQSGPPNYIPRFIPIERGLLFRTSLVRPSPEGTSVLRGAYQAWYWVKRFQRLEGIGVERDLVGLPQINVPPEILRSDATADQVALREALKDLATNVRRDTKEGFLFPSEFDQDGHPRYEFKLVASAGARQLDISGIIARYNQQILIPALADFILLGHEATGSYALGETKQDLFTTALQSFLDVHAAVYNDHAIPRLLAINGMDPEKSPKLVPGKVTETDFGPLGSYLQALSAAGAELFPNDTLTRALLRRADLPDELPDEDPHATNLMGDTPPSQRQPVPPIQAPAQDTPGTGDGGREVTG